MFKKFLSLTLITFLLIPYNKVFSIDEPNTENPQKKVAYLTFDDGPSKNTPKVLDILKENDIKATFFIVGPLIQEDTQYLRRVYEEGHAIGNHTYDHDFEDIYISEKAFWDNYNKCEEYIKENTGIETKLFRFPGGSFNSEVKRKNGADFNKRIGKKLEEKGVAYFDWDIDTGDGMRHDLSPGEMINNIRDEIKICKDKNNIIVLMHDSAKRVCTPRALPGIINYLKSEGYEFKTLNEYKQRED